MGIGVQYHDFATPGVPNTMTVCVILVYVCHPATPEGVNTTNWDMCSNVSQGLSTADAAVLGVLYHYPNQQKPANIPLPPQKKTKNKTSNV